jgi:hypothetical protein
MMIDWHIIVISVSRRVVLHCKIPYKGKKEISLASLKGLKKTTE